MSAASSAPSKSTKTTQPPQETEVDRSEPRMTEEPDRAMKKKTTNDDEAELRRTVQVLFEQEESLLNTHMNNIQENAELLTEEGKMLQLVQGEDATEEDIENYAQRLAAILDRKTHLIEVLQDKMEAFRANLKKEEELSRRVGKLSQY
jgi:hypothetical protein